MDWRPATGTRLALVLLAATAACGFEPIPRSKLPSAGGSDRDTDTDGGVVDSGETSTADLPDPPPDLPPVDGVHNIIFLMGDGMGPGHVEAGRIFRNGPETPLAMETLPHHASIRTISLYGAAIDSAAGATAMATGQHVPNSMVSMHPEGAEIETVLEMAQELGKEAGLVTTARVHDASPASFAAHAPSRWMYQDIIEDFYIRSRPKVILGGGYNDWSEWGSISAAEEHGYVHVATAAEMSAIQLGEDDRLLGLFTGQAHETGDATIDAAMGKLVPEMLTPEKVRDGTETDPRLPDMVAKALDILEDEPDGFFLFIENEHIDEISHSCGGGQESVDKLLPYIVEEVAALDESVEIVLDWIAAQDEPARTLFVITADHDTCGMEIVEGEYEAGDVPAATCSTGGHTKIPVHMWAMGDGAYRSDEATRNTDIFDVMQLALYGI